MRRLAFLLIGIILILSLAAPAGAVFATADHVDDLNQQEGTAVVPVDSHQAEEIIIQDSEQEPMPVIVADESVSRPAVHAAEDPLEGVREIADVVPPVDLYDDDRVPTGDILVKAFQFKEGVLQRIELMNQTSKPVRVDGWKVVIVQQTDSDEAECEIGLHGYVLPVRSVTFSVDGLPEGAYTMSACSESLGMDAQVRIVIEKEDVVFERIKPFNTNELYVRGGTTATYKTGTFTKDFKTAKQYDFSTSMLYDPPHETPLKIIELYPNPLPCAPKESNPPTCSDYVKLYNPTDDTVDLGQYRLRIGQMTSASNASNTYQLSGSVPEKSFVLLRISVDDKVIGLSNESGTAWLQDRYGVVDYPSGVTPYEGGDRVANKGRSWAYNEQTQEWQWATPAPWTFENNFTPSDQGGGGAVRQSNTLKPCLSHQFRNPLTNRCKSTATQANSLKPCRPDQYRNPETNRCRSNTAATSTLKPCRSDQVRNPATNRCKKAVAVGASLADCGPGRERNPETNRCRNIRRTTPPESGFAIEPVADSASVFIGWWVLGGVAFAAAGYASWEWRAEIGRLVRRIFRPNSAAE